MILSGAAIATRAHLRRKQTCFGLVPGQQQAHPGEPLMNSENVSKGQAIQWENELVFIMFI